MGSLPYSLRVERDQARSVVAAARAADSLGALHAEDWVELATQMLASGETADSILDLAILSAPVSRWSTDEPIAALCELFGVEDLDPDAATQLMAHVLADDLRSRPETTITAPLIRMVARLAPPDYESKLANDCAYAEEFLDCECAPDRVDSELEGRLESLPPLGLPDDCIRVLARTARASLPAVQPRHGH